MSESGCDDGGGYADGDTDTDAEVESKEEIEPGAEATTEPETGTGDAPGASDLSADATDTNVTNTTDARDRTDTTDATDAGDGTEEPVEVGDSRQKRVKVVDRSGESTEHVEVYLRHATDEFVVSRNDSFLDGETTRYRKAELARVEIAQHHSVCFITTATVGEGETLDSLRGFRDDALRRTPVGRALVGVYYRVSPPIARTLSRHPTARTTRLVRRLVTRSGTLARRRSDASSRGYQGVLALALVVIYVLGVSCALAGHLLIRLRESVVRTASVGSDA